MLGHHYTLLKLNSRTYNFDEVYGHNLEVTIYNVYITNQFQTTFLKGGGGRGVKSSSGHDSINRRSYPAPVLRTPYTQCAHVVSSFPHYGAS